MLYNYWTWLHGLVSKVITIAVNKCGFFSQFYVNDGLMKISDNRKDDIYTYIHTHIYKYIYM